MAYNGNLPADNDYIAAGPAELRENFRALKDDKIVNAQKLQDLSPGNASGNIPVANGNLNVNLNAEKLGGNLASAFATAGHTHAVATSSSNGMMSNTDKAKLDTVAAGAEVNQNAFSNILVGSTTIQADGKTDTLEMVAGTNIALTPDATNDRLSVAVTGTVASAAACTGNAATATKLATARNIALTGGVTGSGSFDGSGNLSIATTVTGNAPTATKLATAPTINGVAFDGSANITVTAVANGGNAATVGGAAPGTGANNVLKLDSGGKVPPGNLPIASASALGGVKIGLGLSIDDNGVLSTGAAIVASGTGTGYYWRQWSDGIVEQFMTVLAVISNSGSVTFAKAFPNQCISMIFNHTGYNGGNGWVLRTTIPTNTGFSYNWDCWTSAGQGNTVQIMLYAIGN